MKLLRCPYIWRYAPDIAQAALRLIEAPAPAHALYNFSTGVTYSALAAAMPGSGFGCRLARAGERGNVALHGPVDRASMATERATSDLGFTAAWGMEASARHYAEWMRSHPWCFEAP
jgi:UDP-glucose 4-epimerase